MANGQVLMYALSPAQRTALESSRTLGGIPALPAEIRFRVGRDGSQDVAAVYVPNGRARAFWQAVKLPLWAGPWAADSLAEALGDTRPAEDRARAVLAAAQEA
jgi:hypothetical protein